MTLDELLEQARERAEGYGEKRGLKETADDYLRGVYAMLYEDAAGSTVGERDAWVKRQPEYLAAIEAKANRYADWTAAELYMRILFAQVDLYRTRAASERELDRRHR